MNEGVQIGNMANFREKLTNWLASKIPSRTIEVPGGASQGQSLIQRNQIAPVVAALKNTQIQQPQTPSIPTAPPSTLNPNPQIQSITSNPQPPQTMMQGSALIQGTPLIAAWRPVIGSKLPTKPEEKEKLIDAMVQKESSGVATATSTPEGKRTSRGLMQLEKPTWKDVSKWRKEQKQKVYDFDKYWKDPIINREYGTQYIFEVIPNILTKKKLPITFENIMASYTPGVGEFEKGDFDVKKFPNVLRDIKRIQEFYK